MTGKLKNVPVKSRYSYYIGFLYLTRRYNVMLKIAICDDDERMRQYLQTLIQRQTGEQPDLYESGEEILKRYMDYDILFLDI